MAFFGIPSAKYNAVMASCEEIARRQLGSNYVEWRELVRPRLLAIALVPELYIWHIKELVDRGKLIASVGPITYSEVCAVFVVHDRAKKTLCDADTFTGAAVLMMLRQLSAIDTNSRVDIKDFITHEELFRITDEILSADTKEEIAERTLLMSALMMIGSRLIHAAAAAPSREEARFKYPLTFSAN